MNTLPRLSSAFAPVLLVLLVGCSFSSVESSSDKQQDDTKPMGQNSSHILNNQSGKPAKLDGKVEKHMELTGTIVYQNLEGGFYSFISDHGDKYMPFGLASEHKQNGLIVKLIVRKVEDTVSYQQFGEHVEVLNVEVLSSKGVVPKNKDL